MTLKGVTIGFAFAGAYGVFERIQNIEDRRRLDKLAWNLEGDKTA